MDDPLWVKTVHNVCGLACILGLAVPNNRVSVTTTEHSARCYGAHQGRYVTPGGGCPHQSNPASGRNPPDFQFYF